MPRTEHSYLCDVCEKTWATQHVTRSCGHAPYRHMFDFTFGVCDGCRKTKQEREAFIRLIVASGGWTKATASKNYDLYVK